MPPERCFGGVTSTIVASSGVGFSFMTKEIPQWRIDEVKAYDLPFDFTPATVLAAGATKARALAQTVLKRARKASGLE